jgi:GGDEF domain-containing protein
MIILERLHANLQPILESYNTNLGASIGAATLAADKYADLETLLDKADQLMYRVKNSTKNNLLVEAA